MQHSSLFCHNDYLYFIEDEELKRVPIHIPTAETVEVVHANVETDLRVGKHPYSSYLLLGVDSLLSMYSEVVFLCNVRIYCQAKNLKFGNQVSFSVVINKG